jgi:hypothetical protein
MPAPNTITAFHTFSATTLIRSSQVNNNFSMIRGDLMPIDGSLAAFADNTYNLGSTAAGWASGYINNLRSSSGIGIKLANPTTTGATPAAVRFFESDDGNYVGIRAPTTLTADLTYVLPDSAPASNGLVLAADTSGRMYWTASSVAIPTITTGDINAAAVTLPKLAVGAIAPCLVTTTAGAAYQMSSTEQYVIGNGATHTITLYPVSGNTGRIATLRHNGTSLTQVYHLDGSGSETIDGTTTIAMYTNGESFQLICNGSTGWDVIGHETETGWTTVNSIAAGTLISSAGVSTPTYGTIVQHYARWKRSSSECIFEWFYRHSSIGTAGSGMYLLNLPSGLGIDTNLYPVNTTTTVSAFADSVVGDFRMVSSTNVTGVGIVAPYSSSQVKVMFGGWANAAGSGVNVWSSSYNDFATNANMVFLMKLKFPVSNWRP